MSPWALNRLSHALVKGAVIGYPTETIWGFGCDPNNPLSVARILQIKHRPADKGLILLSPRFEYCAPFIRLESGQREILEQPCDRPTTWLVEASELCPLWIRGEHSTVAIRINKHPMLEVLCNQLQTPLVSTSANYAGQSAARSKLQMQRLFANQLDFIVTGFNAGGNRPSDIKSLASGNLLRSGH